MRKKLALLAVLAVAVTALAMPTTASSKTIKLYVTPTYDYVNVCRPAAGQLRFNFLFGAKFERKNSPYPKSVKVNYTARDASGVQFASGKVTLTKKNKWKKQSANITVATGAITYFTLKAKFRSPTTGKEIKSTTPFSFNFATDEELIANGIPPCA